jgi:hypothetical protein
VPRPAPAEKEIKFPGCKSVRMFFCDLTPKGIELQGDISNARQACQFSITKMISICISSVCGGIAFSLLKLVRLELQRDFGCARTESDLFPAPNLV